MSLPVRWSTSNPKKRAERWLVEQRCRCADAMRMTLKVPIRMVLGVVEHICAIKPARMCWCRAERELTYDCRRTGLQGAREVDRRCRRAGRASFAKKKPDVACQGPDLSPGGRRCAWCESLEKSIFPCGWRTRSVARQPLFRDISRFVLQNFFNLIV